MRKLKFSSLETAVSAVFISFMLLIPLCFPAFYDKGMCYSFVYTMQQKLLLVFAAASIIILIFYFINVNKYKLSLPDIFIGILIICGIISVIFAHDTQTAIWGGNESGEGLIALISYFIIFTLAACFIAEDKKIKILFTFMCIGAVYASYSLFMLADLTTIKPDGYIFQNLGIYISSSVSVLFGGIAVGFYLHNKNKIIRYISLAFSVLFYVSVLYTREPMALIAFVLIIIAALIGEFIFTAITKKCFGIVKILALAFLLFAVSYVLNIFSDGYIFKIWTTLGVKASVDYKSGVSLFNYWKNMLDYFKTQSGKWFTGLGIDCVKAKVLTKDSNALFYYKIYNNYLQVLFAEGYIAFAAYLGFIITVIFTAVKRFIRAIKENGATVAMYSAVILSIVGYCAYMFCNFTTIDVEPFFWIICGFACCRYVQKAVPGIHEHEKQLKSIKTKIDDINK